jgi:hypothetical protein
VSDDGMIVVPNPIQGIPDQVILEIHNMRKVHGLSWEIAISSVRKALVPDGYTAYPFRRNTPESFLDMLRSIVATYMFRNKLEKLKQEGADFSQHLYIPEIDSVMGTPRHDRSDHNHLYRRIAKSVREGKDDTLNYEAFDDVLLDQNSGLTHAALIGIRKQSLVDAERLLSYHVVESLRKNGHQREAKHVEIIANWHEASDGRGLKQLTRCKYNYQMLEYILDEWMPWHQTCYDFTTIDINR